MEHDIRFAVLDAYYNSAPDTYHVKHHLDGYNQFVFEKIPQVIAENNPILILTKDIDNKYYKYTYRIYVGGKDADLTKTVKFTKPAFFRKPAGASAADTQEMRALFPNEARNRHMNYVTIVEAPIDVEITTREEDPAVPEKVELVRLTNKFQFRLPVMVRSKLCSLQGLPNVASQKLGEGKQDQGGQFIMGGAEKVVVTQERIAFNEPFTRLQKADEEQVASISISSRALSGVKVRVFSLWLHNLDGTKLPLKRSHFRGLINASISGVNGPVPLFLLFRALGVVNDEDIVRYIYPDGNVPTDVEEIISLNAKAVGGYTTTSAVLEHLRTFVVNRSHTSLQNALRNSFLINQPDDPKSKAIYLGQLTRKLIDTYTGRIPEVDRDNQRQKRVASTGTLMTELFAELQGEFEKEVLRNVTSKQNYNKAVYQDDRNKDMFYEGDPNGELLSGDVITAGISRALRGNWPNIDGAAQALTRLTQFDTISHLRRLVAPLGEGLKLIAPRMVPLSGYGYVCPVESPSGGPRIGLVKNMAVMAQITKESDPNQVLELIEGRGDFLPISAIHPTGLSGGNRGFVVVNGTMIGTVENILVVADEMRAKRRRGELSVYLGVSVDYQGKTLFLRTDADRLTRPLFNARVVRELGDQFREILVRVSDGRIAWADLLTGGLQADGKRGKDYIGEEGVLEMIDTHEANNIFLVSHPAELLTNPSATHCEIHASTIFGVVGSLIPQAPHNQGPRNLQSIAQSKQATSLYSTAFRYRHDSAYILISPQKPLVTTWHYRKQGAGNMGYGDNLIVALGCFTGQNQEDGVLMNRDSIERGLFHVLYSKVWDAEEMESDKTLETLKIEDPRKQGTVVSLKQGKNQDLLDPETGIVRVGEEVHGKDVLIGMTSKIPGQYPADVSISIGKWDGGQVMDTRTMVSPAGKKKVSVKLGYVRIPEFGDKMSSRAGQKGTIGLLVPAEDMPRTADGIVPDLIVNPHAIPKRMTVGQFIEVVAAKAAALGGFETDATAFTNSQPMDTLGEQLESKGFERECDEIMQNGITGEQIPTEIFIGPTQYMRLKHMVKDKQNARATGPMVRLTHQPVHGRADEGGLRIGEMERDSLIGHGLAHFLNESMMERSDAYAIDVCRKSGMPAAVNEDKGIQLSPDIDGPIQQRGNTLEGLRLDANKEKSQSFAKVRLPYTMKLAMEELNAGYSASMRVITESQISRPIPSVQTIRRRRVIKAPKLPAREVKEDDVELGRTSPRNTPEVKEMVGGGGASNRRNSVEDRMRKMGILPPGALGTAGDEQNVPEVGSKDEQIGGLAASILRRKKQEGLIDGLERAPQMGGGGGSAQPIETGNRGRGSVGDRGFGSIGGDGGGGGGGLVISKSGADEPAVVAPSGGAGDAGGDGGGDTKTITLQ